MYFSLPYVPVAEKQRLAEEMVQNLLNEGRHILPIPHFSGKIATTFWGQSWNSNLEQYADFTNRLSRGRSYLRCGCVCHLEIETGKVTAYVLGSELYHVSIAISPLETSRWQTVCAKCVGQVGSLMELLQGTFSREVMSVVCEPVSGIFPSPKEITFSCSCPDYAFMCKHVAAVLYGVGRRLDSCPELLFTLRGVDAADLLPHVLNIAPTEVSDNLQVEDMGALFGIDLEMEMPSESILCEEPPDSTGSDSTEEEVSLPEKPDLALVPYTPTQKAKKTMPRGLVNAKKPTSAAIRRLRKLVNMEPAAFAEAIGVSRTTLMHWESAKGVLNLRKTSLDALLQFQDKAVK